MAQGQHRLEPPSPADAAAAVDCARFSGYKPCAPGRLCADCAEREPVGRTLLLIALDAMGAVIQTTALLPALARRWPDHRIEWVTLPAYVPLLEGNPYLWRVWPWDFETVAILAQRRFDLVLNADKTRRSAALALVVPAGQRLGFGLNRHGQIVPLNPEAEYLWRLGLDDAEKFRRNAKPGTQLLAEAFGLEWRRDEYVLPLTAEEEAEVCRWREEQRLAGRFAVGFNTGASPLFPNKCLPFEHHVRLIEKLGMAAPEATAVLLGGPTETEKNARIARRVRTPALETPTQEGVRRGLLYLAACDVVVTGDTSGLHMALALRRPVVAFFNVTCAAEIDLYERGVRVDTYQLDCSPCWQRRCPHDLECLERLDLDALLAGILRYRRPADAAGASGARPSRTAPASVESGRGNQ